MPPVRDLPTGTVTFLFTDIEGSTRLLQELGPDYRPVQDEHAKIVRKAIAEGEGVEVRTEGDSFFAVFPSAPGAVRAAVTAQRGLAEHDWSYGRPLRVRIGMHTGEGVLGGGDYVGVDVNRAARIAAAGHGGQILLSDATRALVEHGLPDEVTLRDLGEHRLKDIAHPEHLHDVSIEGLFSSFPPLRTSEVPWNVPVERTRFVGRDTELATTADLLERSRLVTLTGSGGSGKTRLAIRAAAAVRERFPGGVVFVDLSPLTDPALVASTIALAAGVTEEIGSAIEDVLARELREREALLVLDNFEQVAEAAPTLARLLEEAPRLRILATSRLPLRLMGEHELAIPPLEIPSPDTPLDALGKVDAVELFVDRARAVRPSFYLDQGNAAAVAELCARLDGLPLAIELAASRVRALTPAAILERLGGRLHELTGGPRDAPARHRTLTEAIRWSDELLDGAASSMLRRLSAFSGGWTLDAAEAIANPAGELGGDTLELTEVLMEHGLLRRDEDRFRMLETVRSYAADRLERDEPLIRERHARFFLDLAERSEPRMTNPFEHDTLAELSRENDNLRAALRWSVEHDLAMGMRIGAALWRFWHLRGHLAEGRAVMEQLLGAPGGSEREVGAERARGLVALAGVVYWQNDYPAARAAYEEAVDIARRLQADAPLGDAIYGLAFVTMVQGDVEGAAAFHAEAGKVFERLGDPRRRAGWMMSRAMIRSHQRELDDSERVLKEAIPMFLELGDLWGAGTSCGVLGQVYLRKGDFPRAIERYFESIGYGEQIGDDTGIAVALQGLAAVAAGLDDHRTALLLHAAGDALVEVRGGSAPASLLEFADPRPAAEKVLGAEETRRGWERGRALDAAAALALARERLGAR